jgi:hypothetical protein
MRKLVLLILGLGILSCCSALAFAGTPAPAPAPIPTLALAADPFLKDGDIQTRVPMVPFCPCDVIFGCSYKPLGFDCAEPAHCCSCRGPNPATRMCVGVPS